MNRKKFDLATLAELPEVVEAYEEAMQIAAAALRRGSVGVDVSGTAKATVTITIAMSHDRAKERTSADVRVVAKTSPPEPIDLDLALPYGSDEVLVAVDNARQMRLGEVDDDDSEVDKWLAVEGFSAVAIDGAGGLVSLDRDQAVSSLKKLRGK